MHLPNPVVVGGGTAFLPPVTQPVARETLSIDKPLTLIGETGAEIRGSDIWSAWQRQGSAWVSADAVPAFNNDTNAARYNKEAADLAWTRTVAFLKKYTTGAA